MTTAGGHLQLHADSVKICSLREIGHAAMVTSAGADLFGLIFAPTRRQVSAELAAGIVAEVRRLSPNRRVLAVGVFVDAAADEINRVASIAGLDVAQLHGNEPPELLDAIEIPVIKAMAFPPGTALGVIETRFEEFSRRPRPPIAYLVDGYDRGQAGGTGALADWSLAADLARRWPVVLAGGLNSENVGNAIAAVDAIGVDVSSGVETDGAKDAAKIAAFAMASRQAFGLKAADR